MNQPYLVTKPDNLTEENEVIDENLLGLVIDLQKTTSLEIDEKTKEPSQTEKIWLCVVWPFQPGTPALTFFSPEELCFVEIYDPNSEDEDEELEENEEDEDIG